MEKFPEFVDGGFEPRRQPSQWDESTRSIPLGALFTGQLRDTPQQVFHQTVLDEMPPIRMAARSYGIALVDAGPESIIFQFTPTPPIDPRQVIALVQSKKNYRLAGPERLRVEMNMPDTASRTSAVRTVLRELESARGTPGD